MFPGASGVSTFMEVILKCQFPQAHLLTAMDFLRYLDDRGIRMTMDELEYYDEKGVIRPAMRLNRPLEEGEGPQKYAGLMTDIHSMQRMHAAGWVELPRDDDFKPWSTYKDGYEEKTWLYYHPFQFVSVRHLTSHNGVILSPGYLEKLTDVQSAFENWKKRSQESLAVSQRVGVETWIPRIGLLMLLEEAYHPLLGQLALREDERSADSWNEWRFKKFEPQSILSASGMTIEQVKAVYDTMATAGHMLDPMAGWYPLVRLIKPSKRRKLKAHALLAQSYYELAEMVRFFIFDLTKEKMLEPDDMFDGNHKNWKPRRYGNPFDYESPKTQQLIRDDYFMDRPSLITLIFEGDTEETVISKILGLFMSDPKREGYHLYNAEGSGNMGPKNLDGLIDLAKSNQMEAYLIIDNDGKAKSTLQHHLDVGNIRSGMFTIWQKDFEYDNFGLELVVAKVNDVLKSKGYNTISKDEVERRMMTNSEVLMRAIDSIVRKNNGGKKLDDILSKRALAEDLIAPRLAEIVLEYRENKWQAELPIEKVIKNIFQMFPYTL